MAVKKKRRSPPVWANYWLLTRRAFPDEAWVKRWTELKEVLRSKVPR